MSVLIADDDDGFRTFVARVLEFEPDLGPAAEAINSEEAVGKALQLRPDLILMDMDLPGTGGLETTQRIKGALPETVVIMISTLEAEADREAAAKSGAAGCLPRTASIARILDTLRKWLPDHVTQRSERSV